MIFPPTELALVNFDRRTGTSGNICSDHRHPASSVARMKTSARSHISAGVLRIRETLSPNDPPWLYPEN
jgi:hypothetical protein